ncbi:MAG: peptidylprolyl isomerase [Gammaproteobacteria bacterium]|jgi:FKBP-type peptidyl-prolyl cis-trans isomerase SlyD|nr:peptidylprolyl isomerase [Gammaproteobacteria bacterium]
MEIDKDHVVSLHYTLTNDKGETLDSSAGGEPLAYLHGAMGIIPGLEKNLAGRAVGDQFEAIVRPEDAYGEFNEKLIDEVPRESFAGIDKIEIGMQFQAGDQAGNTRIVTIKTISEDVITIDANHPLAGQVLHFDVSVEGIRPATEEEIEHGHPH